MKPSGHGCSSFYQTQGCLTEVDFAKAWDADKDLLPEVTIA